MTHANRSPILQYSFRRTPWPVPILVPYGLDNTAASEIPLPFGLPGHLLLGPPGLPYVILLRDVPKLHLRTEHMTLQQREYGRCFGRTSIVFNEIPGRTFGSRVRPNEDIMNDSSLSKLCQQQLGTCKRATHLSVQKRGIEMALRMSRYGRCSQAIQKFRRLGSGDRDESPIGDMCNRGCPSYERAQNTR